MWLHELAAATRVVDGSQLALDLMEIVEDNISQARGICSELIRGLDASGLARSMGATSTGALLRARLRLRPGEAYSRVRVARHTARAGAAGVEGADGGDEGGGEEGGETGETQSAGDAGGERGADDLCPGTGRDLADGLIHHEHAAVIVSAMGRLHESVSTETRAGMESELRAKARILDPAELAKRAQDLIVALNPRPDPPREKERSDQRRLRVVERDDGMTELYAVLDQRGAETVRAGIDPLSAPCAEVGGIRDPRSTDQRCADALVEGFDRLLSSANLPTQQRVRPHVSVLVDFDTFLRLTEEGGLAQGGRLVQDGGLAHNGGLTQGGGLVQGAGLTQDDDGLTEDDRLGQDGGPQDDGLSEGGGLAQDGGLTGRYGTDRGEDRGDDGVDLAPAVTTLGRLPLPHALFERISCDAEVRRIVFGPRGEILDIGRASRNPTAAIRAGVIARDRLCTHPGCDRPAGWCDVHHVREWGRGRRGRTAVTNCALVCGFHHDLLHSGEDWEIRLGPTHRIEWRAPAHVDPERRWRSNPIRYARDPYGCAPPGAAAA